VSATDTSNGALLERLAREAELLGAHHAEYVTARETATPGVQEALRAAVSFGCAMGLRRAAELIREVNT
jgi:hypothetical protein